MAEPFSEDFAVHALRQLTSAVLMHGPGAACFRAPCCRLFDNRVIIGLATPEDAAHRSMPAGITHVVETRLRPGGDTAYVLLAVEVAGTGYYLDENLVYREPDGSWSPGSSGGGGFSVRTLADLRANPPPQGLFDSHDPTPWPAA